jgi:hypothetical protein
MTRPTKVAYLVIIPLLILAMVMAYNRCAEYMRAYNELREVPSHTCFEDAMRSVAKIGHSPYSPHHAPSMDKWEDYMRYDIKLICECDAIVMLPGWEGSKGANIEYQVAKAIGCEVFIGVESVPSPIVNPWLEGDSVQIPLQ